MALLVHQLLGELFIEFGLIEDKQVNEALDIQKESHERLGQILLHLGYITEINLMEALGRQFGIAYISLTQIDIDDEVIAIIPQSLVKRYGIIPIKKFENKLTIAMSNPTNFYAIDDARAISGMEIDTVIASESEINRAINEFYGAKELVAKASTILNLDELAAEESTEYIDDAPVIDIVNTIIAQAIKEKASDIHIEPMDLLLRVRFRIDGVLREYFSFSIKIHALLVSRIKIMSALDIAEKRIPQDGRIRYLYNNKEIDLRVSTIPTILGEKIVIRILDKSNLLTDIKKLGFSKENLLQFQTSCYKSHGMVLVTGPTGSGKSTTLYAVLTKLNDESKNIVTIENPVEYRLNGINQIQVNPKAGLTFSSGLRAVLRQDPNIIMIGEIRDSETADIAVKAALTGHLVFSTLHTNNAIGAISRLIDIGVKPFLVTSSVLGILAQRLVRRICPKCKTSYIPEPDSKEQKWLGKFYYDGIGLYKGIGCPACNGTGYKGRIAISEVLTLTKKFKEIILSGGGIDNLQSFIDKQGIKSMYSDGIEKVLEGKTTIEEVVKVAYADSR